MKPARLHLDWLDLTAPQGWLKEVRAVEYQRFLAEDAPWRTPLGLITSPVLVIADGERAEVLAELHANLPMAEVHAVYCPAWWAHKQVGSCAEVWGVPKVNLTGSALRRLGWQSAYRTTVELAKRMLDPPSLNVSRVDVAVEYPVGDWIEFVGEAVEPSLQKLAVRIRDVLQRGRRRALPDPDHRSSGDGVTWYLRRSEALLVRAYWKWHEGGIRIEMQVRRPRPEEGQDGDTHAQVLQAITQARHLFGELGLPFHSEEAAVQVDPVTGEIYMPGHGVSKQKSLTLIHRGFGLVRKHVAESAELSRDLLEMERRVEAYLEGKHESEERRDSEQMKRIMARQSGS